MLDKFTNRAIYVVRWHKEATIEKSFWESLRVDKTLAEDADFNPYYRQVQTGLRRKIVIEGKPLISLGSNDYLGLANSEELKKVARAAIDTYGISMCGTPIVVGYTEINQKLEARIAEFLRQDEALVFPSGYQANLSAFHLLAGREDVILVDRYAHASLIQGAQLSRARLFRFPHNDVGRLEDVLKKSPDCRMRFIAVDGLYSTEGDLALLDRIVALAKEYRAFTIVDDAHGLGILGDTGRGVLEIFDVLGEVDMVSGSFGKALGCSGGFIATSHQVADLFRYRCGPFIYSTALPPVLAATTIAAIDLIEKADAKRRRLVANKERLYASLKEMGYSLTGSTTPLFSVTAKEAKRIIELARDLCEKGVYAVPFVPPSVPRGRSCLRCIPHANLEREDIDHVIQAFRELKGRYT